MSESSAVTFLFTDIEGSTRLWEQEPDRMRPAMAQHDTISRAVVERHRGSIVKMRGDGVHAAFANSLDALIATIELQQMLQSPDATGGLQLRVRCGLHAGADERRDGDFYGRTVNRAARIVDAAHGGQMLLSKAVADQISKALPAGIVLRDLGTVRLRDLSEPERVYQVQHPQLRADFPALRSLEATPNNLTQQLNSFIGRERELAEVRQMLATNRLVTLLGMGGIGKSRLSVQLAAEVLEDFPDGVWFIELAALTDPRSVPQALASVLGVKEEAGRPVIEALLKYVRDKRLLVVLDNCEHVVHACAELTKRLLQAGPGVRVLTSSRDYLKIAGETTYHVPTLSAPDPQAQESLSALAAHEAVRLFIDRVTAARPEFVLTGTNATAVADICHRLDGIPLAIELAAARARALSVENIAARLNDRFKLLATNDRTVLPRQRTLRALIDWSYDLLDERERAVFQRVSVFAGGWTLEAAEAVCADSLINAADVLDLQAQLVEKSLVVMDARGERYRMLDTVRTYALEELDRADADAATRARHLHHFLDLAEEARQRLGGPEQGAWLSRLDAERENMLSAHAWCGRMRDLADSGLRLASAMKFYLINRGLLALAYQMTTEALANQDEAGIARCRGLFEAGQIAYFMARHVQAKSHLEASLAIARSLGDAKRVAAILQPLGLACLGLGDEGCAERYLVEALELAKADGDPPRLAAASNALAQLYRVQGKLDAASKLYDSTIALARSLGDKESLAIGLLNQCMVLVGRSQVDAARPLLNEALAIAESTGSQHIGQSVLEVLTGLFALAGDWQRAAYFFGCAEAQAERSGLRRDPADEAFLMPRVETTRRAIPVQDFARQEQLGRARSLGNALAEARSWLEEAEIARTH